MESLLNIIPMVLIFHMQPRCLLVWWALLISHCPTTCPTSISGPSYLQKIPKGVSPIFLCWLVACVHGHCMGEDSLPSMGLPRALPRTLLRFSQIPTKWCLLRVCQKQPSICLKAPQIPLELSTFRLLRDWKLVWKLVTILSPFNLLGFFLPLLSPSHKNICPPSFSFKKKPSNADRDKSMLVFIEDRGVRIGYYF